MTLPYGLLWCRRCGRHETAWRDLNPYMYCDDCWFQKQEQP